MTSLLFFFTFSLFHFFTFSAHCADWPMWRFDSSRSASSPEQLPDELYLAWVYQYSPRTMVWDDPLNQDLMPYDRVFEPVVAGRTMLIGFNDCDKVTGIDCETGREKWSYYVDGPVRFPPAVWNGKAYFTSDDGYLYCVSVSKGTLIWKFRGGPDDRKILGNRRLISTWPARGGPVVSDGRVYFAASIWPFMGTFIYSLDAETGAVVWINDRNGSQWMLQPHNAPSFAGVAPQGALTVSGDRLLVPGGRSVPACFDKTTGELLYYRLAESGKTGGSFVCAGTKESNVFFNHHRDQNTTMYQLQTGIPLVTQAGRYPVIDGSACCFSGEKVTAYNLDWTSGCLERWAASEPDKKPDLKKIQALAAKEMQGSRLWELDVDATGDLIKAGSRLYAAGGGTITAIDLAGTVGKPAIVWTKTIDGSIERLVASNGMLFAVTLDGRIMAFGAKKTTPALMLHRPLPAESKPAMTREALALIRETGVSDGYALLYGIGDGDLLEALAVNSDLHIIAVDPDEKTVEVMRRRFDRAGLCGTRIAALKGDPLTLDLPPYMASLTVVNRLDPAKYPLDSAMLGRIYTAMRPYGGKAVFLTGGIDGAALKRLDESGLHGLVSSGNGALQMISRDGSLEGASSWTHNYGNIANTSKSDDNLVQLPLGILWFGGNSNLDVLPRHGHGPAEQVIGGRLFIEGVNSLSARDVYTGRVLWNKPLLNLGTYGVYYDETYKEAPTDTRYNQKHLPGANIRGTNFIAALDRVYVIQETNCDVIDVTTGETVKVLTLPPGDSKAENPVAPRWGYIGVYDDLLIAGSDFVAYSDLVQIKKEEYSIWEDFDGNASKKLVIMNRYSSDVIRQRESGHGFLHNGIAAGNDMLFCIDRLPLSIGEQLQRRIWDDFDGSASKKLVIMNRYSGDVIWQRESGHGFLHNGIAAGNGMLFCIDRLPLSIGKQLQRRGKTVPGGSRIEAIDMRTGTTRWEDTAHVFGSFLAYSEKHDILLQSTRPSRDMVSDEEGTRMLAFRGSDGAILWDRAVRYTTFPILHGDMIIIEGAMFSLLSGEDISRTNPITGTEVTWTWNRQYGCNYPIACEHLITFRSGAAGFYDVFNESGTGNFGGFKSGCTSSLVAADGVLNAPDYTRTCQCAYQNQTSLAMIHMPVNEVWTYNLIKMDRAPIRRLGINLGAPGDRLGDNGTLWLDYPSVGGPSPEIAVTVSPETTSWYCHHSSFFKGDCPWVVSSGGKGIRNLKVRLSDNAQEQRNYTVRLYFAEPEGMKPGERVFDVSIQGRPVLERFDIIGEAKAPRTTVVREFRNINVNENLEIALDPSISSKGAEPVLSGVEVIAEGW